MDERSLPFLLDDLPEPARSTFKKQWREARGSWEREDVIERIELTLKFYEENEWAEGLQRWVPKEKSDAD